MYITWIYCNICNQYTGGFLPIEPILHVLPLQCNLLTFCLMCKIFLSTSFTAINLVQVVQ